MWLPTLDLSFPPHSLRRKWAPNDPESYSLKKMWLYIVGENLARRVISRHSVVYKIAVVKALDPSFWELRKSQFSSVSQIDSGDLSCVVYSFSAK